MTQIFRVESIAPSTTLSTLPFLFTSSDRPGISIKSLSPHPHPHPHTNTLVATISFISPDDTLRYPQPANTNTITITIDDDFEGLTPLHDGANFDIIAVSDPFDHPYYSWSASAEHAWLRDDLLLDIEDAHVLLYGHDVELHSEKGMLEACAEKFLHTLQQARACRHRGSGKPKPMVLLGLRTGCLVIEKAMVLAQAEAGFKELEAFAGVVFFDAPHTGLPAQFLDMLPEGRSKSVIAGELEEGSSALRQLDVDFARVLGTCSTTIVSCVPKAVALSGCGDSRNWPPSSVVVMNNGRREVIAQLRRTEEGEEYARVIRELKQCLGLYPPPSPTTTTSTTEKHTMKPAETFINFSMPARSPKRNSNRKDSLSPLASPTLTKYNLMTSQRMSSSTSTDTSPPPSPLQRISNAASRSTSGHTSSASSISSISVQSLVFNKYTISPYMYPESPAQTPPSHISQSSSGSGLPFPSPAYSRLMQFETPPDAPTPLMSSASPIDRDGGAWAYPTSPTKIASMPPKPAFSRSSATKASTPTPNAAIKNGKGNNNSTTSFFSKIKRAAAPPKSDSVRPTIMEELGGYPISLDYM